MESSQRRADVQGGPVDLGPVDECGQGVELLSGARVAHVAEGQGSGEVEASDIEGGEVGVVVEDGDREALLLRGVHAAAVLLVELGGEGNVVVDKLADLDEEEGDVAVQLVVGVVDHGADETGVGEFGFGVRVAAAEA